MVVLVIITKNNKTDGILILFVTYKVHKTNIAMKKTRTKWSQYSQSARIASGTPYTIQNSYSVDHLNKEITAHIITVFSRHVHTHLFVGTNLQKAVIILKMNKCVGCLKFQMSKYIHINGKE